MYPLGGRIIVTVAVVVFVLLLPVIVPVAVVLHYVHQRKMRALILSARCPKCFAPLDDAAIARADERWREIMLDMSRQHPGARLRVVRDLHATCTICGAEITFVDASHTLILRTA